MCQAEGGEGGGEFVDRLLEVSTKREWSEGGGEVIHCNKKKKKKKLEIFWKAFILFDTSLVEAIPKFQLFEKGG